MQKRMVEELVDMSGEAKESADPLLPRQSGSLEWRLNRGEMNNK
jgi:hypothetical protein